MKTYWLTDRYTGEVTLVNADTFERLLGVELWYVEWRIRVSGVCENGKWRANAGFRCDLFLNAQFQS